MKNRIFHYNPHYFINLREIKEFLKMFEFKNLHLLIIFFIIEIKSYEVNF